MGEERHSWRAVLPRMIGGSVAAGLFTYGVLQVVEIGWWGLPIGLVIGWISGKLTARWAFARCSCEICRLVTREPEPPQQLTEDDPRFAAWLRDKGA